MEIFAMRARVLDRAWPNKRLCSLAHPDRRPQHSLCARALHELLGKSCVELMIEQCDLFCSFSSVATSATLCFLWT